MVTMAVRLGADYWHILGPVLVALALITWVVLTVRAARRRVKHPERVLGGAAHRGDVQGGIIHGDPVELDRYEEKQDRF
ncbi:hypothetical protein [Thermomonospora umbrina]|uniref:Uncharacterized protein n=1 Tax=Thermomonospora umbrina TaxID=111806 RepID=A0A3D9SKQ9_9ACTN|nr:hypothetical protein [Thermomonospora umbrina]REE96506.1 hypothetical protein DFJ69_1943 [Thermomonospora umbrina]